MGCGIPTLPSPPDLGSASTRNTITHVSYSSTRLWAARPVSTVLPAPEAFFALGVTHRLTAHLCIECLQLIPITIAAYSFTFAAHSLSCVQLLSVQCG